MQTIKEILFLSKKYLEKAGVVNPRYSSEEIIAHVLGCKRLDIYLDFDRPLSISEIGNIREFIRRRHSKEPLQYILGSVDFFHCNINVTKDVLIPRSETEQLVDRIVKMLQPDDLHLSLPDNTHFLNKKVLWDICTGSGCIALALKKVFPMLDVVASDISSKALSVAKINAKQNNCEIDFRLGDMLEPFKGEKADFVVCNPPYISEGEYNTVINDVRKYEPRNALIAKDKGTFFYKKLENQLISFLNPRAKVFFEIGYRQKKLLNDVFVDERWISKKVYKDLSGKDRFFFLEIE